MARRSIALRIKPCTTELVPSKMAALLSSVALVIACLAWFNFIRRRSSGASRLPPPPGPKGLPILGNIFQVPTKREWLRYSEWFDKYGDMINLNVLGQNILILNSADLAREMFESKGSVYSGRPTTPMVRMCGIDRALSFQDDPVVIRKQRLMLHKPLGTRASVSIFYPSIEAVTHSFLKRMMDSPQDYVALHRFRSSSLVLSISHGYAVKDEHDPLLVKMVRTLDEVLGALAPGNWLVDVIPALQKLPDWFPGARFKQVAKRWRVDMEDLTDRPHQYVKSQLAAGTASPSMTSSLIDGQDVTPEEEDMIKWAAFTLYGAGIETSTSVSSGFFLAMALYPEVFKKAQEEVDRVIGQDRLPSIVDREQLPYIHALTLEILRWCVSAPTGLPHKSWKDDIHNGYFIPKGTIVVANLYHMLYDPRIYKDPERFNPERFMGEDPERDPRDVCFGFGRRVCPGRGLADASLFIVCAMSLVVFDIKKKVVNGHVIEPIFRMTTGIISQPEPYDISVTPRSEKAITLIHGLDISA